MATESATGTHKDPVTGEMISKTELKRRTAQREREARKAEKAAQQPAAAKSEKVNEDDLNPNQYYELRSRQILKLRETQDPNPYPHKFNVTKSITNYIEEFGPEGLIKPGERLEGTTVSLAGRVHNIRASGQKLRFYDLHGEGKKVQIMATLQDASDPDKFVEPRDSTSAATSSASSACPPEPRRANSPSRPRRWSSSRPTCTSSRRRISG